MQCWETTRTIHIISMPLLTSFPGWAEAAKDGCAFILQSLSDLSLFGLHWNQRSGKNYSGGGFSHLNSNVKPLTFKSLHLQAFELLCDLLLLYSPSSAHSTPSLQTLVYLPSDSLRCDMAGFLIDYIFSDDSSDLNGQYLFCIQFLLRNWFVFLKYTWSLMDFTLFFLDILSS